MNEPRNLPPEKAEALRRRLYGHDHYLATSNASATGFTVFGVSSTSTPLHNAATEQHGNVSQQQQYHQYSEGDLEDTGTRTLEWEEANREEDNSNRSPGNNPYHKRGRSNSPGDQDNSHRKRRKPPAPKKFHKFPSGKIETADENNDEKSVKRRDSSDINRNGSTSIAKQADEKETSTVDAGPLKSIERYFSAKDAAETDEWNRNEQESGKTSSATRREHKVSNAISSHSDNPSSTVSDTSINDDHYIKNAQKLISHWKHRALTAESQVKQLESDLQTGKLESDQLREQLSQITEEYRQEQENWEASFTQNYSKLAVIVRDMTERIARSKRKELTERQHKLGRIVPHRTGPHNVYEAWEDGAEIKALMSQREELKHRREELEKQQKSVLNAARRRKAQQSRKKGDRKSDEENEGDHMDQGNEDSYGNDNSPTGYQYEGGGSASPSPMNPPPPKSGLDTHILEDLERVEEEESVKTALAVVRREELKLDQELQRLKQEKAVLQKDLKRARDEETSRFAHRPILGEKYLLLHLLGKGGFSEVWQALDLSAMEEVALKIHQLSPNWSDVKKSNYIKHATREYSIHRSLKHPNVVQLRDVFEIDLNSFATVLEYCPGQDLDQMLKQNHYLIEREARAIIIQVLAALRYFNNCGGPTGTEGAKSDAPSHHKRRIIHYDLKPGNILFDKNRRAKITDFGLSKILEDADGDDASSMELTSQGAGTYWYLPPECFHVGSSPPRISDKVDVWSIGVIFYQMLYGKRPFGDGQTQERLLQDKVILRAQEVTFPEKPQVSKEAKRFIQKCLTPQQHLRPDVKTVCQDPYLRMKLR